MASLEANQLSETAKSRHDFIGNIQHVMLATHLQTAFVIAFRRNNHSSRSQHGFGNERSNILSAKCLDCSFKVCDFLLKKILHTHALRTTAGIDIRKQVNPFIGGVQPFLVARLTTHARTEIGATVIRFFSGNHLLLAGTAQNIVVKCTKRIALSTAVEPQVVKKTCFKSPSANPASFLASRALGEALMFHGE